MTPPARILLATDLSSRSDRAQDRAASLAKQHDCELIVLHVLESPNKYNSIRRIPFLPFLDYNKLAIEKARKRLLDDMSGIHAHADIMIEEGVPHEIIMRVAEERNCDCIVTGVARNEILGQHTLGKTVNRLLGKSRISLLIVNERYRGPYSRIAVSADISPISKHTIETAAAWFPEQALAVVYPFNTPKSYAVDNIDDYREQMRQIAHRDLTSFISTIDMTEDQRARLNKIIENGNETTVLKDFIRVSDAELAVIGSRKQGFLSYTIFGNHAKRIIPSLSCDVFVVRSRY